MSAITFYTNPMSRGRIVRWMLEELGEPYFMKLVSLDGDVKSDDYRAINPMGKVPTIVHAGRTVTECAAICAYLADAFPQAKLAPQPGDRDAYYRWMFFAAGPLEAATTNRALGFQVPDERRRMVGYGSYDDVMNTLDAALSGRRYVAGDTFTAADVYVGSHIGWGLAFGSIEKRPAFLTYLEGLQQRPAYQQAEKLDEAARKELEAAG